ncbi:flagellar hook assembly protein FlgD [Nitrosovibrio sp. Nv6]|uniref:flagellar hook assembly protein FlgD n=1 Tax=Nitrosovibrio sp. Nv6 TaxID=1855340 RepID=UPI0008C94B0C|nr:flagellar hook assembly protein FlgD [Nitrosovibrio sp. Nv6]SEO50683.1 flagellar basal-body rod modification protein FlgD [Nitrosovibrio sp. Nv6]
MSTIQDPQSATKIFSLYGAANTPKPVADEVQDRFLKLLVTQMKNQDPLNPLDNAQVTTQLAQISTVNGIEKLNANIQAMASSFNAGQSLQAATMIGKDVLVPGSMLQLTGGSGIFGLELPHAADQVKVTIHDASGRAMQVMDLGAKPAGSLALTWDGMTTDGAAATDGVYSVSVSALRGDQKIDAKTLAFGSVQGVSQGSQGVQLNVGTLGPVGLTDVKQIF